ncbi:MAG: glycosyltransferase [Acidobacteria bacterium]|nr:glycosyltransferase [Acidobacteriota bacterium]MBV9068762.1 glycosyltransferase [Acidobacteriota bacterium]MBV9188314.1 glycosyltransferase [Acidobacteriota bacterium]
MHLLGIVILTAWVMALIRTIVNLKLIPSLRADMLPASEPLVSVIIPARDEAHIIERTVRAFLAQTYANLEVIVVNDRSADGTGDIVRSIDDVRLTVIDGVEPPAGWLGKPWALHQGSRAARGALLLFVDADVVYAPAAIRAAAAHHEARNPSLLSLLPHFEMHGFGENAAMPMLAMTCFSFLPTWFSNRTRFARLAIGGGTGNLVSRDAYENARGHEALKNSVVDDVALARLIRRSGGATKTVRADDLVSLHMYNGLAEVVEGFTKNAFAVFGRSYVVGFLLTAGCAIFHILPYVLAITGDRVSIATIIIISLTRLILFSALRYRLDAAIFLHPVMAAIWMWIFIRSIWLTGIRRKVIWRGRTYDARHTRFGAERR